MLSLRAFRRKWVIAVLTAVAVGAVVITVLLLSHNVAERRQEARGGPAPVAPPDLKKFRDRFSAGVAAVIRKDGADAVNHLSSFSFGTRAVEEYRLYYLAGGHQMAGNRNAARRTFAHLWARDPKLVYRDDVGMTLGSMHAEAGDSVDSANVFAKLATRTDNSGVAAAARWSETQQRLLAGDVAGAFRAARRIVVANPRSTQAADAVALLRAMWALQPDEPLHLTPEERMERAVSFLRDGDPQNAFDELSAFEPFAPASLRDPVTLNRGLALFQLRKYDDAIRVLEPLTSGAYKFAIPALYHLSKSYRILSSSIDPTVYKTVIEKKNAGTIKVRVGKGKKRRTVTKPKIVTTRRTVKLVDLAKQAKKDNYDRLANERLKDLLQLPLATPVRLEVLNTLIVTAEAKNQDEYEQQLVREVVKIDPISDPGLQHFWDKGWAAYLRGDFPTAKLVFRFIADTYTNTNVKRQSEYWYARTLERQGQREAAQGIYQRLAAAPYLDLYAFHAMKRGASRQETATNPLKKSGPDWQEIAEKQMPDELRLAYELTALNDFRDARAEVQKNLSQKNDRFGQALLAEIFSTSDDRVSMYRAAKRAFPQLATVDQDSAPAYFLDLYYPVKYTDAIRKYASRVGVDSHLVMGLILQESYYNPKARSAVGATGLMQIMPSTGKELAQRLHVPFGQSRLENPEVNVQLGTAHLKMLINMFDGNEYLAIASYNAGQGNVLKWKRGAPGKPLDEFLESIPFAETRNYVKRVTMLRSAYTRIVQ